MVFEVLCIGFDIQNIAESLVALAGTGLVRAGNSLQMWKSGIQLGVIVELTDGLFLVGGDVEGGFQNEGVGGGFGRHEFLVAAVAAEELETGVGFVLQE